MPTDRSPSSDTAALRYVAQRLARRLRRQAQYGLTASQVSALTTLERQGPLRLGELARREQVGKSSMTQMVAKLDTAGYLTRRVDPDDRRGFLVELTEHGTAVLTEASARENAYLARQLGALDVKDRQVLAAAIPVLEKLLELRE